MTSTVPNAIEHADEQQPPITMFGPDFPYAYDDFLAHPAGLGQVPATAHGTEVAVIGGGLSGIVAAYELMKMGLKPVVYEADRIGGRLRTVGFEGCDPSLTAEMGAMRFPPSSTALRHYIDLAGLETRPFPNPLAEATPSTVVDLKGESHYAETLDDLPQVYRDVADAWARCLEEGADFSDMNRALRERDVPRIREIWAKLVERLDNQTFYGFLCDSEAFKSFRHREIFGQVGFGTGGWDTDFPNSILEILRVVYTEADDHHRGIVGGSQQLPLRLWEREPEKIVHWPYGTSLRSLHVDGEPRPAVTRLNRTAGNHITVTDANGDIRTYPAAIFTALSWMLLSKIACDDSLFPIDHWTAIERTHYMESSKLFVPVDRPFWLDKDEETGRDVMSMTLTDRMTRGTYLLDDGPDKPAVICLSYTWCDDSLKWLPLSANERMEVMLKSLGEIYPKVDIRKHVIGNPVTVSWENEPYFMGAFKANLPGHYRYQRRLFTHFMQDGLPEDKRGIFLAGDDISWTAGWAEGAVQTALNAVWGVMHHFGGETDRPTPARATSTRSSPRSNCPRTEPDTGSVRQRRQEHPAGEADRRVQTVGELTGDVGLLAQRPQRPGRRPGGVPGAFQAPRAEQMGQRVGDPQQLGARGQLLADTVLQRDEEIAHGVELPLQVLRFAGEATTGVHHGEREVVADVRVGAREGELQGTYPGMVAGLEQRTPARGWPYRVHRGQIALRAPHVQRDRRAWGR